MATLPFPQTPTISLPKPHLYEPISMPIRKPTLPTVDRKFLSGSVVARSYKVVVQHEGQKTELEVEPDEAILFKALQSGLAVPHDCKMGVCMTCAARLVSGTVDQSEGMLSDDVVSRGYALLCSSKPTSDCHIETIPEDDLLRLQLATAND